MTTTFYAWLIVVFWVVFWATFGVSVVARRIRVWWELRRYPRRPIVARYVRKARPSTVVRPR